MSYVAQKHFRAAIKRNEKLGKLLIIDKWLIYFIFTYHTFKKFKHANLQGIFKNIPACTQGF